MKHLTKDKLKIICALTLCLILAGCSLSNTAPETLASAALEADNTETVSVIDDELASGLDEKETPLSGSPVGGDEGGPVTTSLPSSYDSRDVGKAAPVRDQKNLGTCWAFASLSAIESRLLPGESWDFSEDHMSHDPYFRLGQTGGGEYTMAMAYLLSWRGPVTEEEDPYGDEVSPLGLSPAKHVQEIVILPDNDIDAVKRAVMRYGSVETSIYMDISYVNERSDFYNPSTVACCCPLPMVPNHDITITGWDDDFPKEAFIQPVSADGAFICENNWGVEFGRDGFFYVSYEDRTIGADNVVYTVVDPVSNYSAIYQCDECGWIGQMGYNEESAWAANVYRAGSAARLCASGFYAIDKDTSYEVYVVRNIPEDPGDADFDEREKVAEGKFDYAGYYTIPFSRDITLTPGERFAVIIHLVTPGAVHPIAIEYDSGDGKCVIDINGESYASYNGKFWEHTQESQECDICLKAYTR